MCTRSHGLKITSSAKSGLCEGKVKLDPWKAKWPEMCSSRLLLDKLLFYTGEIGHQLEELSGEGVTAG